MPAYLRAASSWARGVLRLRGASSWSSNEAGGFQWNGSSWVRFQPDPDADADLLPPENFRTTLVGSTFLDLAWDNPSQTLEPTQVQYRMPELTSVWTELPYPASTVTFSNLNPSAAYQVQIRYVIRVDGIVVMQSAIRELFATTDLIAVPGSPAERDPTDPSPTPGDSTVEWPLPIGGGAGPVGGSGCWWEYVVQELLEDNTYADVDPLVTGELDGDVGDWDVNFVNDLGLSCTSTYRLKFREVCDSVPGAWNFAEPFIPACDWREACAGRSESPSASTAPFDDAIFQIPWFCPTPGSGVFAVLDLVSLEELGRGSGLSAPLNDADGEWALLGKLGIAQYESLAAGALTALEALTDSEDFSITIDTKLINAPGPSITTLIVGNVLRVILDSTGGGYRVRVTAPRPSMGALFLQSAASVDLGDYGVITITIDADGDKELYVDGQLEDSDTSGAPLNFAQWDGTLVINGNASQIVRRVAGWDRVLDIEDIELIAPSIGYRVFDYTLSNTTNGGTAAAAATSVFRVPPHRGSTLIAIAGTSGRSVGGSPNGVIGQGHCIQAEFMLEAGDNHVVDIGGMSTSTGAGAGTPGAGEGRTSSLLNHRKHGGAYSAVYKAGETAPFDQSDVLILGAGGGGGGQTSDEVGGNGGYPAGQNASVPAGVPAGGGTASAAGAGGQGSGGDGDPGTALQGGGGIRTAGTGFGAGGGGGYNGGGGGGGTTARAGGGGSSFVDGSGANIVDVGLNSEIRGNMRVAMDVETPPIVSIQLLDSPVLLYPLHHGWSAEAVDYSGNDEHIPIGMGLQSPLPRQQFLCAEDGPDGYRYARNGPSRGSTGTVSSATYGFHPAPANALIPAATVDPYPGWCIEGFWFPNPNGPSSFPDQGIFQLGSESGDYVLRINLSSTGQNIRFIIINDANTSQQLYMSSALGARWHHFLFGINTAREFMGYIDGAPVSLSGPSTWTEQGKTGINMALGLTRTGGSTSNIADGPSAMAALAIYDHWWYDASKMASRLAAFGLL